MTQTLEPNTRVERIKLHKVSPEVYEAMMALTSATRGTGSV
jgi:hypothetical protein